MRRTFARLLILPLAWTDSAGVCAGTAAASTDAAVADADHADLSQRPFAGRTLASIFADYTRAGLALAWSSRDLNDSALVRSEVPAAEPLVRLDLLLAQFGLTRHAFGSGWVIRRRPSPDSGARAGQQAPGGDAAPAAFIEHVVVTSSQYRLERDNGASALRVDADEFDRIPALGGDAVRTVTRLPGAATIGLSAKPRVRGGADDETLVLFDGVELLDPFHLKDFENLVSTLNPGVIDSIRFYTGGFPARYGNRMSGVLDIEGGPEQPRTGGEFSVSLLNVSALVHGSTERLDWVAAGRRGNLDLVTKAINPQVGEPSYHDAYGRLTLRLGDTRVSGSVLSFVDGVRLNLDDNSARSDYRNLYAWLEVLHTSERFEWGGRLSAAGINHRRSGFADDPERSVGVFDDRRKFAFLRASPHVTFTPHPDLRLRAGADLSLQDARYRHTSSAELGDVAAVLGLPQTIAHSVNTSPRGTVAGLWGAVTNVRGRFTWEVGARFDLQNYGNREGDHQISPRASVRFDVSETTRLKVSAGRFYQPQGIHELQSVDGVGRFQGPQRSDHLILGVEHETASGLSLRAETYIKRISQPKRRFENVFNGLLVLPEIAADRVAVASTAGRATGIELSASLPAVGPFSARVSYAVARAEQRLFGRWAPVSWDQRHTLNALVAFETDKWLASAGLTWHSGWPVGRLPADIDQLPFSVERAFNRGRLADYLSLDVRLQRRFRLGERVQLDLFAEVINSTARSNRGAEDYEFEFLEDGGALAIKEQETLLPTVPSIGFTLRF